MRERLLLALSLALTSVLVLCTLGRRDASAQVNAEKGTGRYQISGWYMQNDNRGCFMVDTATGEVWMVRDHGVGGGGLRKWEKYIEKVR